MARNQMKNNAHAVAQIVIFTLCLSKIVNIASATWLNHGRDLSNRRYSPEGLIRANSIYRLHLKWEFFVGRDITATPSISADGVAYFPAWDGYLYAVNAFNGALVWKQNLTRLTGLTPPGILTNVTVSRATPTIAGDRLLVGIYGPAVVIAVNRFSGSLLWSVVLDPRPTSVISMSGTAYRWSYYTGVSSIEEGLPPAQCCIFRGSMASLDIETGTIKWRTYTIPDNGGNLGGYAGGAIWGSSPSIDILRKHVYVGTGNLYIAPPEVLQCQEAQNNQTNATHPDNCVGPDIHFNSILAFDLDTGRIEWSQRLGGYDVWYTACLTPNNPDCPPGPNPDADFGEAPMLLTISSNRGKRDIVAVVQKSGFVWALDRNNGAIVWFSVAGPGGIEGGGVWGAATDGVKLYTNIVNNRRVSVTLTPSNQTTTSGIWVALDVNTGKIVWSTANPSNDSTNGPVTLANDVLFAGSVAPSGPVYAIDADTGNIIWSYVTNATVYGGASTSYGCFYIGNGFAPLVAGGHPTWTHGKSLFAFCVV